MYKNLLTYGSNNNISNSSLSGNDVNTINDLIDNALSNFLNSALSSATQNASSNNSQTNFNTGNIIFSGDVISDNIGNMVLSSDQIIIDGNMTGPSSPVPSYLYQLWTVLNTSNNSKKIPSENTDNLYYIIHYYSGKVMAWNTSSNAVPFLTTKNSTSPNQLWYIKYQNDNYLFILNGTNYCINSNDSFIYLNTQSTNNFTQEWQITP